MLHLGNTQGVNMTVKNIFLSLTFFSFSILSLSLRAETQATLCLEATANAKIDTQALNKCLEAEGLSLEVHGIVGQNGLFVVTFRNPENFFDFLHLSLIPNTRETRQIITTLKRHDVITVKGFIDFTLESPQPHIKASSIMRTFSNPESETMGDYTYQTQIPTELNNLKTLFAKVHAVFDEGKILVIEYKDAVLPVFVDEKFLNFTKNLYRGDLIEIDFTIQRQPRRPVHLNLREDSEKPVRLQRSVVKGHGEQITLTGKLLRFPKSPMVQFPVFAIDVEIASGITLPHTVLSFTNPTLFRAFREKCQKIWEQFPQSIRNVRNKLINDSISLKVKGTYNMIDPGQANPQIVIESLEDVEFL
jgi:hypothetical protein